MNLIRVYLIDDFDRTGMLAAYRLECEGFISALAMLNMLKQIDINDETYKIVDYEVSVGDEEEGTVNCVDVKVDYKFK